MTATPPPRWADRLGRGLLGFDAIATLGAFGYGITQVMKAPDASIQIEFWAMMGYLVFATLWGMLAWAPRRTKLIWEMILVHKIAVTLFAFALIDTEGAQRNTVSDTIMVLTTVAAYFLCRGWQTWSRPAPAAVAPAQLVKVAGNSSD